jgi:hypothetical protein
MSFSNFCLPHSSAPEPSRFVCKVCRPRPRRAAHHPEPVARPRSQPLGFHGAVFRCLRRAPDVVAPPGEDAPRSRAARRQRAVYRPSRLERRYQNRSSFTRTFRRHYGGDPSEYRARATPSQAPHPPRLRSRNPMQPSLTPAVAPRERRYRRARLRRGRLAATGNGTQASRLG